MTGFICVLCGSKSYLNFLNGGEDFEYGIKGKFNLIKCVSCGLISLFPVPSTKQLLSFYPSSYHCYNNPVSRFTQLLAYSNLKRQAKKIERLIGKQGKILDVGCAGGEHFGVLNKFGNWQFVGIDFNKNVVEKGQKKGREIYATTLEKFNYTKQSFDLIIMDHLLEHVTNPVSTLKSAYFLLKKDGYLIGAVPNINSWDRVVAGRYWGGYHFPRHVYLFSLQTLTRLFVKNHFRMKKIDYDLHTGHWALSVQNFFQSRLLTKRFTRNGRTFYYGLLLLFFFPLNLLQRWFKSTGIIDFTVQK